jgi:hypothetical protein
VPAPAHLPPEPPVLRPADRSRGERVAPPPGRPPAPPGPHGFGLDADARAAAPSRRHHRAAEPDELWAPAPADGRRGPAASSSPAAAPPAASAAPAGELPAWAPVEPSGSRAGRLPPAEPAPTPAAPSWSAAGSLPVTDDASPVPALPEDAGHARLAEILAESGVRTDPGSRRRRRYRDEDARPADDVLARVLGRE